MEKPAEEILNEMIRMMPYKISVHSHPYILEAMKAYTVPKDNLIEEQTKEIERLTTIQSQIIELYNTFDGTKKSAELIINNIYKLVNQV